MSRRKSASSHPEHFTKASFRVHASTRLESEPPYSSISSSDSIRDATTQLRRTVETLSISSPIFDPARRLLPRRRRTMTNGYFNSGNERRPRFIVAKLRIRAEHTRNNTSCQRQSHVPDGMEKALSIGSYENTQHLLPSRIIF